MHEKESLKLRNPSFKPPTIIVDLDGVIVKHLGLGASDQWYKPFEFIEGTVTAFNEWEATGAYIIIMTARKRSCRYQLERDLSKHGIYYDMLIMGVTSGTRVLINDKKSDGSQAAVAFEIERNAGLCSME